MTYTNKLRGYLNPVFIQEKSIYKCRLQIGDQSRVGQDASLTIWGIFWRKRSTFLCHDSAMLVEHMYVFCDLWVAVGVTMYGVPQYSHVLLFYVH